ncbi:MAG: SDR family oxidoreductase [Microbacterium sp.]|nr:SDR family oxidoreductase [Microbacterium sp.]
MHVFITGATGWIGSAVAAELIDAGHDVTGLARSDANVEKLEAAGIRPHRGDLHDLESLRAGATGADVVIHFGNLHDFSNMAESGRVERAAVETFGDVLAGSGGTLVVASGMAGTGSGILTETDASPHVGPDSMRGGSEHLALSFADRGVRPIAARFAPTVHGVGDHGFIAHIAGIAREKGVSAYVGDGANRWPAVHRLDAAHLVRLAIDDAAPGTVVHAVAEGGVPTRDIATAIGTALGVPAVSIAPEDAAAHFGWIGMFFAMDLPASSEFTRERFGWNPTHPTLLEDIAAGAYTV